MINAVPGRPRSENPMNYRQIRVMVRNVYEARNDYSSEDYPCADKTQKNHEGTNGARPHVELC
jgi:hypothetical protein